MPLVVSSSSADGGHHWHQLPERPDGHLWRESVLRGGIKADDWSERRTYRHTLANLHMHINHNALIRMVAAHTNKPTRKRLASNCPFLSVVETAGLCHVNERREVKLKWVALFSSNLRYVLVSGLVILWLSVPCLQRRQVENGAKQCVSRLWQGKQQRLDEQEQTELYT